MEPQQQFTEVRGKFPKFVTTDIPPSGIKTLKTLEMQEVSVRYCRYCTDFPTSFLNLLPTGLFNSSNKL